MYNQQRFFFRDKVDKLFASMDRDFDGRLTLEEFLGEETPIEKLFKLMDRNGDGFVTKKECFYCLFQILFKLKCSLSGVSDYM